jgi:hypothetical protein
MKLPIFIVLIFFITGVTFAAEKTTTGIIFGSFPTVTLPENDKLANILADEDYNEPYKGYKIDLNGDGIDDFVLEAPDGLCGTGGCGYLIIDGKSFRKIGDFFGGGIIISNEKVNKHLIVKRLQYSGPETAQIETYIYKGNEYILKNTKKHSGKALKNQLAGLQRIEKKRVKLDKPR